MTRTLLDMGERRILREIIPQFVDGAGDDCAEYELQSRSLVITTDPVPKPAAQVIGGDPDLYWLGWLLVTINASDVAAAGARPEGFLAAFDLPSDLAVDDFERLLSGVRDSCKSNGLAYIGGNVREANSVSAVGTAFGSCIGKPLNRRGAKAGDLVVVLGQGGKFWSDALNWRGGMKTEKMVSPLFAPISQSPTAHILHGRQLLRCAMDTSDGLVPTLDELSKQNRLTIKVDLKKVRESSPFHCNVTRIERLWLGWGDWTVVCAVSERKLRELERTANELNAKWSVIGEFVAGDPQVIMCDDERQLAAGRLESERFASDSWFAQGIDEYIARLTSFELP